MPHWFEVHSKGVEGKGVVAVKCYKGSDTAQRYRVGGDGLLYAYLTTCKFSGNHFPS